MKRYEYLEIGPKWDGPEIVVHENGKYVLYTDAAAIEQERDEAYKDRDRWRETVVVERKVIDELEQERDRLRGQRDRMVALLRVSLMHAEFMETYIHTKRINDILTEIEKESHE